VKTGGKSLLTARSTYYKSIGALAFGYFNAAGASQSWDPSEWEFGSFHLYRSVFDGIVTGHQMGMKLSKYYKDKKKAKESNKELKATEAKETAAMIARRAYRDFRDTVVRGVKHIERSHFMKFVAQKVMVKLERWKTKQLAFVNSC